MGGCPANEPLIDHMASWIPRKFLDAYFSISPTGSDNALKNFFPEQVFTANLRRKGADFQPADFRFVIVRTLEWQRRKGRYREEYAMPLGINPDAIFTCDTSLVLPKRYSEICLPQFTDANCDEMTRRALINISLVGEQDRRLVNFRAWMNEYFIPMADRQDFDEMHLFE